MGTLTEIEAAVESVPAPNALGELRRTLDASESEVIGLAVAAATE